MISADSPNVKSGSMYSISETCDALGICRDSLRRYTNEGYIQCGYRSPYNRKFYLGSEIVRFWRETVALTGGKQQ